MTLKELQAESDRILAESLQIASWRRKKWIKAELKKRLSPDNYRLVFQWISTTEALDSEELNVKATTTQLLVSIGCVIVGTILAFRFSQPTGIQYWIIRGLFAVGIVGIAVRVLMGTVNVKWSLAKSLAVTATGGFGLLILIYFFNPPAPPSPDVPQARTNSPARN